MTQMQNGAATAEHPSLCGGGAATTMTTGARAEVHARVARLAHPGIASPRDLLAWLNGLDPHQFARVARLVLTPREPARHVAAPALGESVADAVRLCEGGPRRG